MRDESTSSSPAGKAGARVQVQAIGDVALVSISGLIDERFPGFGKLPQGAKTAILDVSQMSRLTSFGVRQWIKAIEVLPQTVPQIYLLGCPTFFVDQLNMVLNFGGAAQVVTAVAPFSCAACGLESGEQIDVLAERAALTKGGVPEKACTRCGDKLEFDETPESYFSFVAKYGASGLTPDAAAVLASQGLYTAVAVDPEKPPKIIKLVHGSVTYFHITGQIGGMFRARPFLVGAEGEVVIDLANVTAFDPTGLPEFTRLLKTLCSRVPSVTLIDLNTGYLQITKEVLRLAPNLLLWSVSTPYRCLDCDAEAHESIVLAGTTWPPPIEDLPCTVCGGTMRCAYAGANAAALPRLGAGIPPASENLIAQRDELLARAHAEENSSQGETAAAVDDDTILGKYKIVRRVGNDGLMDVFLAKQVGIGGFEKIVMLKRVQGHALEARGLPVTTYLARVRSAGGLRHPNIVQLLDVGEVQGELYLATEFVNGPTLGALIDHLLASGAHVPLGVSCYVVREIAQAVHQAYWATDLGGQRLGVAHGDLAPHTIALGRDGTVKVMDYGFAVGGLVQPPAPEDHRRDLFALGELLFVLGTGQRPFAPNDVLKTRYTPVQRLAPDHPPALAALIDQMLTPGGEDRPQTGQQVAGALSDFMRSYGIEPSPNDLSRLLASIPDAWGEAARPASEPSAPTRPSRPSMPSMPLPSPISRSDDVPAIEPRLSPRAGRSSQSPTLAEPLRPLRPTQQPPMRPSRPSQQLMPVAAAPRGTPRPTQPPAFDQAPAQGFAYEFPPAPSAAPTPISNLRVTWWGLPPGLVLGAAIVAIAVLMYLLVRPT